MRRAYTARWWVRAWAPAIHARFGQQRHRSPESPAGRAGWIGVVVLALFAAYLATLFAARRLPPPWLEWLRPRIAPRRMLPACAAHGSTAVAVGCVVAVVSMVRLQPTGHAVLLLAPPLVIAGAFVSAGLELLVRGAWATRRRFHVVNGVPVRGVRRATRLSLAGIREGARKVSRDGACGCQLRTLTLALDDGTELQNAYLDPAALERDAAALANAAGYRAPAPRYEPAAPLEASGARDRAGAGVGPGVVAVAIGSMVVLGVLAVAPRCRAGQAARVRNAVVGAGTIRKAAELHANMGAGGGACPTVDELVAHGMLLADRVDDPWGTRFEIVCQGDEVIGARSAGPDRQSGTPDDVLDRP